MKIGLTILLGFAGAAIAAPRTLAADLDDEMGKLQGAWVSTSFEAKGSETNSSKVTLTFNEDRLKMKVNDRTYDFNYQLDVDSEPKQLNIVTINGGVIVAVNHGIYKLDGNKMTICHGGPVAPTKFEIRTGPYSVDSLIVLEPQR